MWSNPRKNNHHPWQHATHRTRQKISYSNQPCLEIICRLTWRILLRTALHTGHWVFPLWTFLCSQRELRFWNTLPQMLHCSRSLTRGPLWGPPTHSCWGSTNRQKGTELDIKKQIDSAHFPSNKTWIKYRNICTPSSFHIVLLTYDSCFKNPICWQKEAHTGLSSISQKEYLYQIMYVHINLSMEYQVLNYCTSTTCICPSYLPDK